MKAFIISISALLLFTVIVSMAFFLYYENLRSEKLLALAYYPGSPSFAFDDVSGDLAEISSLNVSAKRNSSSAYVFLQGSFSNPPSSGLYSYYSQFISSNYSSLTNANITLDASGLSDSSAEAIFSNGLACSYAYSGASRSAAISSGSGDTGIYSYEANISVGQALVNQSQWASSPQGDLNVTLFISDMAGNVTSTVSLNRSSPNTYTVDYAGGQLSIQAGSVGAVDGAFEISANGSIANSTSYSAAAQLPPGNLSSPLAYYWNARMNYSQANVSKSGWVEIGRA